MPGQQVPNLPDIQLPGRAENFYGAESRRSSLSAPVGKVIPKAKRDAAGFRDEQNRDGRVHSFGMLTSQIAFRSNEDTPQQNTAKVLATRRTRSYCRR